MWHTTRKDSLRTMPAMRPRVWTVLLCMLAGLLCRASTAAAGQVWYVKQDVAGGANTGENWSDAFIELQAALAVAQSGDEIWVAAGTYLPDFDPATGAHSGLRTASFRLTRPVFLYGGFAGGETDKSQRAPGRNVTILSGDIGQSGAAFDNVFHVIIVPELAGSAYLDSLSIRDGQADGITETDACGGAVYADATFLTLRDCSLTENNASQRGGAIYAAGGSLHIRKCVLNGNSASQEGGAVFSQASSISIANCLVHDNTSEFFGGAVVSLQGEMIIVNCTFTNNSAGFFGGAISRVAGAGLVGNCVLWQNTPDQVADFRSDTEFVRNSCVQGGFAGPGNISTDPLLLRYRPLPCSPCIDAGDNTLLPSMTDTDLDGRLRCLDHPDKPDTGNPGLSPPVVDIGAYEYEFDPGSVPGRLYVKRDATGANDGTSWENAFVDLTDAVAVAASPGLGVTEIWVAAGKYIPDRGTNNRDTAFRLANGVTIYGGFAGTETDFAQRDPQANLTILSGDIGQPGFPMDNCYHTLLAEDVDETARLDGFQVSDGRASDLRLLLRSVAGGVMINRASPSIARCTITGNSAGSNPAVYSLEGSPTFEDCVIQGNSFVQDGGNKGWGTAEFVYGSPSFVGCTFGQPMSGSLRFSQPETARVVGCRFLGWRGADSDDTSVISAYDARSVEIRECTLTGLGCVAEGVLIALSYCDEATVANCIVTGYRSNSHLNLLGCSYGTLDLVNCAFVGNSVASGSVMSLSYNRANITNCTIVGNQYAAGGACNSSADLLNITNSILWNPSSVSQREIVLSGSNSSRNVVAHSLVRGGRESVRAIGSVILDWEKTNTEANPVLASSDDYHLLAGSPCVDAGDSAVVPELPGSDVDGRPRVIDGDGDGTGAIDIGASERDPAIPLLAVAPSPIEFSVMDGEFVSPAVVMMGIRNGGAGGLAWAIDEDCDWLQLEPRAGESAGETDEVAVRGDPTGMQPGQHECSMIVSAPGALGAPRIVSVIVNVNRTLRVPSEYPTIQSAIDAAVDGDVVLLADGTYRGAGNVDLVVGKTITIRGKNGPSFAVIDAQGQCPCIWLTYGQYQLACLDGLTLTNGSGNNGGSLVVGGGCAEAVNCRFVRNSASSQGGGVYVHNGAKLVLRNCSFAFNSAPGGGGLKGSWCDVDAANCCFWGNSGTGGAMSFSYSCTVRIGGCLFVGNQSSWSGGAISTSSPLRIVNSVFTQNSAAQGGGAISLGVPGVSVSNSVFWSNRAKQGREVRVYGGSAGIAFSHCLVPNQPEDLYKWGSGASILWLEGNVHTDPLFVDPDGPDNDPNTWEDNDYHLLPMSPGIDAGDNAAVAGWLTTDLDGQPRVQDGDNDSQAVVDMGPYEHEYRSPPSGPDFDSDGDVDARDVAAFQICQTGPDIEPSGPCAGADFTGDGDADQEDFGLLQACLSGPDVPADPGCLNR